MNPELEHIASQLTKATKPEDVFGDLGTNDSLPALRRMYHSMAKVTHPDVYQISQEKILAQAAFSQLVEWFNQAEQKIKSGRYGKVNQILLQTRSREYELDGSFTEDDKFNFYSCTFFENGHTHEAVVRIVRDPRQNEISHNEVRILNILLNSEHSNKFLPYFPNLLDAFIYEDEKISRQATIFEKYEGWYSLQDVHREYPHGIDPKDMAWIWRRMLVVLGFAHANSVIHGAVLPGNIWIQPEEHGLMLKNWFYSVHNPSASREIISKVDPSFADWYPQEILKYEIPTFGIDISMSAQCMIYLLGGDVKTEKIPDTIPNPMRMFLKGCILPGTRTPQDAWAVKQDFDDLLGRLWGARKFHPFKMSTPIS